MKTGYFRFAPSPTTRTGPLQTFPHPRARKAGLVPAVTRGYGNRSNWTIRKMQNWNRSADHSFEFLFMQVMTWKTEQIFVSLFSQFRPRDGLLLEVDWYWTWLLCILRNNTRQRFIILQPKLLRPSVHWDFTARYILLAGSILQGKSVKG